MVLHFHCLHCWQKLEAGIDSVNICRGWATGKSCEAFERPGLLGRSSCCCTDLWKHSLWDEFFRENETFWLLHPFRRLKNGKGGVSSEIFYHGSVPVLRPCKTSSNRQCKASYACERLPPFSVFSLSANIWKLGHSAKCNTIRACVCVWWMLF